MNSQTLPRQLLDGGANTNTIAYVLVFTLLTAGILLGIFIALWVSGILNLDSKKKNSKEKKTDINHPKHEQDEIVGFASECSEEAESSKSKTN